MSGEGNLTRELFSKKSLIRGTLEFDNTAVLHRPRPGPLPISMNSQITRKTGIGVTFRCSHTNPCKLRPSLESDHFKTTLWQRSACMIGLRKVSILRNMLVSCRSKCSCPHQLRWSWSRGKVEKNSKKSKVMSSLSTAPLQAGSRSALLLWSLSTSPSCSSSSSATRKEGSGTHFAHSVSTWTPGRRNEMRKMRTRGTFRAWSMIPVKSSYSAGVRW